MGAAREGFDLFHRYGRQHIWRELKRGKISPFMWRDTFGRFACMLMGHNRYDASFGSEVEPDWACRRCCKFIK